VNNAHAGDVIVVHPGTYHGSVAIRKNFITIRGAGDSASGTVLKPKAGSKQCGHSSAGFCVIGKKTAAGVVPVKGTRLSGFLVKGFHGFGFIAQFAKNTIVMHNAFVNNSDYGAAGVHVHANQVPVQPGQRGSGGGDLRGRFTERERHRGRQRGHG